jgi:hypothetical protein
MSISADKQKPKGLGELIQAVRNGLRRMRDKFDGIEPTRPTPRDSNGNPVDTRSLQAGTPYFNIRRRRKGHV